LANSFIVLANNFIKVTDDVLIVWDV